MIVRPAEYMVDGMPTDKMLQSVVREHMIDRERLRILKAYYEGDSPIVHRERTAGLPNNRIAHPIARYIANTTSGYLIGNAISYSTAEESDAMTALTDMFKRISVSAIDAENARNAAIYGRGIEYIFVNSDGLLDISSLNPETAFVVYDDTHENRPLFGVYYIPHLDEEGAANGFIAWIMGSEYIRQVKATDAAFTDLQEIQITQHYFGNVPLVEYWNGSDEKGDFECVIPLIDAYDKLESDRVNDKEQFVDALLVLTGCTLDVDEKGRTPGQQLREDKALTLPDNQASAQYLTNSLHESDVDILRKAICDDIHKYAMVPNLADESFASNSSGVAMRYKLLGLEYLTGVKEQWFREGLRTRLRAILHFMDLAGQHLDAGAIEITMTRSMPNNLQETVQTAQTAKSANAASVDTLVKMIHPDWTQEAVDAESARIKSESEQFFNQRVALYNEKAMSRTELRAQSTGETDEQAQKAIDAIPADDAFDALLNGIANGEE